MPNMVRQEEVERTDVDLLPPPCCDLEERPIAKVASEGRSFAVAELADQHQVVGRKVPDVLDRLRHSFQAMLLETVQALAQRPRAGDPIPRRNGLSLFGQGVAYDA